MDRGGRYRWTEEGGTDGQSREAQMDGGGRYRWREEGGTDGEKREAQMDRGRRYRWTEEGDIFYAIFMVTFRCDNQRFGKNIKVCVRLWHLRSKNVKMC